MKRVLLACLLFVVVLAGLFHDRLAAEGTGFMQSRWRRRLRPMTWRMYRPLAGDVPNPERGFFHELDFHGQTLNFSPDDGTTLVRVMVRLDPFRETDLPDVFLKGLEASFENARRAGVKLIVRFAYNDGPYPNPEPDAPLDRVLGHIQQLGPVLTANSDVIAWFEAGFIGAWGEWHSSTYGLDTPPSRVSIRDAILTHFPQERFVLFRYPRDIIAWYPQPLSAPEAFSSSWQARVGHHNDCFLASPDDEGTYLDGDGTNRMEAWQAYLAQMTRFVPMAGETCAPNPPRTDCPQALAEMVLLHWSALNEDWHPEVIEGFRRQGCYDQIRRRLGYRLVLTQATWNEKLQPGGKLSLGVQLVNQGFAAPLLPRPVYVLLEGQQRKVIWLAEVDPRRWEPGVHSFTAVVSLPQDVPAGTYRLALWLPDPSLRLKDDPRYALRLANEGVWDAASGTNTLGEVTVASPSML